MSLRVTKEPEDLSELPAEDCCICETPTRYWHRSDVALCQSCAKTTRLSELPTKAEWFEAHEQGA